MNDKELVEYVAEVEQQSVVIEDALQDQLDKILEHLYSLASEGVDISDEIDEFHSQATLSMRNESLDPRLRAMVNTGYLMIAATQQRHALKMAKEALAEDE